jgi:putative hemolysin
MIYLQLAVILLLIAVNGFLAMSELAVVSSRPARLKVLQAQRVSGAGRALALNSEPGRFLSTVQTGITLIGVLSGAFSGATIGLALSESLGRLGISGTAAQALGVGSVVALITYGSLIFGELAPKQIALRNPEAVAVRVAPLMVALATTARPVVWLLDVSARLVLSAFGVQTQSGQKVSEEEIKMLIGEAESVGILAPDERHLIAGVMRFADRRVRGVMTPRTEVEWLNLADDDATARVMNARHSRLPVAENAEGAMIGVVEIRRLLASLLTDHRLDLTAHIRRAPIVPDSAGALGVLAALRSADVPMALVHDEYGHFEGIVTPADLLGAIAGVFRSHLEADETAAVRRRDGSWLLPGSMPADEMAEHLAISLPTPRDYQTVAGFVIAELQHLPATGEAADAFGWRFEVVDMDGRRIDKVLASRLG